MKRNQLTRRIASLTFVLFLYSLSIGSLPPGWADDPFQAFIPPEEDPNTPTIAVPEGEEQPEDTSEPYNSVLGFDTDPYDNVIGLGPDSVDDFSTGYGGIQLPDDPADTGEGDTVGDGYIQPLVESGEEGTDTESDEPGAGFNEPGTFGTGTEAELDTSGSGTAAGTAAATSTPLASTRAMTAARAITTITQPTGLGLPNPSLSLTIYNDMITGMQTALTVLTLPPAVFAGITQTMQTTTSYPTPARYKTAAETTVENTVGTVLTIDSIGTLQVDVKTTWTMPYDSSIWSQFDARWGALGTNVDPNVNLSRQCTNFLCLWWSTMKVEVNTTYSYTRPDLVKSDGTGVTGAITGAWVTGKGYSVVFVGMGKVTAGGNVYYQNSMSNALAGYVPRGNFYIRPTTPVGYELNFDMLVPVGAYGGLSVFNNPVVAMSPSPSPNDFASRAMDANAVSGTELAGEDIAAATGDSGVSGVTGLGGALVDIATGLLTPEPSTANNVGTGDASVVLTDDSNVEPGSGSGGAELADVPGQNMPEGNPDAGTPSAPLQSIILYDPNSPEEEPLFAFVQGKVNPDGTLSVSINGVLTSNFALMPDGTLADLTSNPDALNQDGIPWDKLEFINAEEGEDGDSVGKEMDTESDEPGTSGDGTETGTETETFIPVAGQDVIAEIAKNFGAEPPFTKVDLGTETAEDGSQQTAAAYYNEAGDTLLGYSLTVITPEGESAMHWFDPEGNALGTEPDASGTPAETSSIILIDRATGKTVNTVEGSVDTDGSISVLINGALVSQFAVLSDGSLTTDLNAEGIVYSSADLDLIPLGTEPKVVDTGDEEQAETFKTVVLLKPAGVDNSEYENLASILGQFDSQGNLLGVLTREGIYTLDGWVLGDGTVTSTLGEGEEGIPLSDLFWREEDNTQTDESNNNDNTEAADSSGEPPNLDSETAPANDQIVPNNPTADGTQNGSVYYGQAAQGGGSSSESSTSSGGSGTQVTPLSPLADRPKLYGIGAGGGGLGTTGSVGVPAAEAPALGVPDLAEQAIKISTSTPFVSILSSQISLKGQDILALFYENYNLVLTLVRNGMISRDNLQDGTLDRKTAAFLIESLFLSDRSFDETSNIDLTQNGSQPVDEKALEALLRENPFTQTAQLDSSTVSDPFLMAGIEDGSGGNLVNRQYDFG